MKINIVSIRGTSKPECTKCGHRFKTEYAGHPYAAMCRIALGEFNFCPYCGSKYEGCQIEGVDLDKCADYQKDWLNRGKNINQLY